MTKFTDIQDIIVKFKNRDGVDTYVVVDCSKSKDASMSVDVGDDGVTAYSDVHVEIPNGMYSFKSAEDWSLVWRRDGDVGAPVKKPAELGKVGKTIMTVVTLAILTPFVGILWAWSADVVRDMGGFW